MAKQKRQKPTTIDFDFGIGRIIPATQEAYSGGGFDSATRKIEKETISIFREVVGGRLDTELANNDDFPATEEVFVFIMQYFRSEKEYGRRDIDNMAKSILDLLRNRFYYDDGQVKTVLASKKTEQRIPQDFAYIAIKRLRSKQDVDALKISGLERSVTMFQELKKKGIL